MKIELYEMKYYRYRNRIHSYTIYYQIELPYYDKTHVEAFAIFRSDRNNAALNSTHIHKTSARN